jgi:hypothetical protein
MKKIVHLSIFTGLSIFALSIGLAACIVFPDDSESQRSSPADQQIPVQQLPVVSSANIPNSSAASTGKAQFKLEWKSAKGKTEEQIIDALKDVHDKWNDYVASMDALPFLQTSSSKQYEVWSEAEGTMKLNNSQSGSTLKIPRYWDSAWGNLTVTTWPTKNTQRKDAFLAAKKNIEDQMAAIKASSFWNTSYKEEGNDVYPLRNLHERMGDFIKVPSAGTLYADRSPWGEVEWNDSGGTLLHPTKTGPLYELYFGHIPTKDEYLDPDGTLVYPMQ